MAQSFEAQVTAWVSQTHRENEAIFKAASQATIAEAQLPRSQGGRMRVDTGFNRNSLVSGLNGSTSLSGAESYILAIAQAALGDTIEAGWTSGYAYFREVGVRGQPGDFYMRGAAQNWPKHVAEAEARLRG